MTTEATADLSYGSYLEVPALLELQQPRTDAHDEVLFIVTHQAIELWFTCALHELERIRACMDEDRIGEAGRGLRRVNEMVRLWLAHVEVLGTMSPAGFNEFRGALGEASGFQSVQFRELEMLSGIKDRRYLNLPGATTGERDRIQRRFTESSLNDAFHELLTRRGLSPEKLYAPGAADEDVRTLAEDMLDYDALFHQWRYRHWLLVVRTLGGRVGSGGSAGEQFLRTTLDKWFFPDLHEARSGAHTAVDEAEAADGSGDVVYGCPMGHDAGL